MDFLRKVVVTWSFSAETEEEADGKLQQNIRVVQQQRYNGFISGMHVLTGDDLPQ